MTPLQKATDYIEDFYAQQVDPKYVYHSLDHTLSVLSATEQIASMAQLSENNTLVIQIAALFHDTGFNEGPENHEERSAKIAEAYLNINNFEHSFIEKVIECILATKMDSDNTNRLAQILQDADLSGLASEDFFDITEKLRKERSYTQNTKISKSDWDKTNIDFLRNCHYKTEEGKTLFQQKKDKNLATLIKRVKEKKKEKKNTKKSAVHQSISTNKSAQTQFKTALRNHIDLSNIADNKANIMLSVNALILTVALPFLIDKTMENPSFLFPTLIMSVICLASMIFATLATRPIKMEGYTTQEQIKSNKSNLFFFGNYHKMTYDEYNAGVQHILSDPNALDDSITRDLFYLGKSLGKKFDNLRLCYTIFMYGITVTVAALLVVYLI